MNTCRQCNASLTAADRSAGRCPHCGAALDGRATVPEVDPSATMAHIDPVEPSPPPVKPTTIADVLKTVDFAAPQPDPPSAPAAEAKSGTVYPLPNQATIDFPPESSEPSEPPKPTSGSKSFDAPPGLVDAPVNTSVLLNTFDSDSLGSSLIERLSVAWGDQFEAPSNPFESPANPRITIKGKGGPGSKNDQTLVVNTRAVRDAKRPQHTPTLADYELLGILGEGGMGVVYTARQASIDRTVAVKMLKPALAKSRESQQKFLSEAVVTGDLDHPNIVPMYDLGKNEAGDLFYAMKRVEGTPWSKAIGEKTQQENIETLLKVCDAVAFAHARGVVHRDLKPENVMLGEFGEVLVMDWGLAYSTAEFRKSASITHTHSMGGSPAYMAPEMATGPIERITSASDIYLLGAILYEIVTGRPPHTGTNVSQCLMSAARNEILPTERTGELVDVARRAMATETKDRYPTVQAFQAAIRQYLAHSESIALSARAEQELTKALATNDYQDFARAVFGYDEALALWSDNKSAADGLFASRTAYARCAYGKGDFDLAAGLLDTNRPEHVGLLDQIAAAQREREARKQRLRQAKRFAAVLVVGIFVVGTVAYVGIRAQRDRALRAEEAARRDRDLAEESRIAADAARVTAVAAKEQAETAKVQAETAKVQAETAKEQAVLSKEAEEYAAYAARIGLAAARIDENAFEGASQLLDTCPKELRNWEWGRLKYLCDRDALTIDAEAPVSAVAYDAEGRRCASGGWNGKLRIWNAADGAMLVDVPYGGAYVHAVAFSPDGRYLAAGGSDKNGFAQLFNSTDGKPLRTFTGHADAVLSVTFDRTGKRLLTSSADGTARLWDVESGAELNKLHGHSASVWSAAFSPDETTIITTGQDGTAIVWPLESAAKPGAASSESPAERRSFLGHKGPIHAVAFAPDGLTAATGGDDRRVLVWKPADVRPYRLTEVFAEQAPAPTPSRELAGHRAGVFGVAFSPDGTRLVSGGLDNALVVWDAASGEAVKTLRGHAGQVRACRFSPDGKFILSGAHDGTLRLWNIDEYEETRAVKPIVLAGHADAVLAADFSQDERTIVTAGRDRIAKLWDVRTLKSTATLAEGHEYLASSLGFTKDGKRLVTAAVDGTTRVWDVAAGVELRTHPDTGRAAALAVSDDGRLMLTGDGDRGAKLWETESGRLIRTLPTHHNEVTAVAISRDGKRLFTGESSGRANVWTAEDGGALWSELHHSRKITAAAFTADGSQLLTGSLDDTVGRWDAAAGRELTKLVWKHPAGVVGLALVGDDRAATTCEDGRVRLWTIKADSPQAEELALPTGKYAHAAASGDGKLLSVVDHDARCVRVWDVAAGKERGSTNAARKDAAWLDLAPAGGTVWAAAFAPDGKSLVTVGGNEGQQWNLKTAAEMQAFRPHGAVAGTAFSPDGKFVATAGWDDAVKIWSVADGRAVRKLRGKHQGVLNGVAYDRDGRRLLTAGDDRTARLWDVETGEELQVFTGHVNRVTHAAFSADGKRVVTASADKTARICSAADGKLLHELTGHAWTVLSAEFSHDGKRVVTAGADDVATIWDAETGKAIRSLAGHTAAVSSAAFSPDGRRVVTGSHDGNVKVWDADAGKELLTLKGHADEVTAVRFSRTGRYILTAGRDGGAILWPTVDW